MTAITYVLTQLIWTAATLPAIIAAVLYTRYGAASPLIKTWVCRAALVNVILILFAIGVNVLPNVAQDRTETEGFYVLMATAILLISTWIIGGVVRFVRLLRLLGQVREMCACAVPIEASREAILRRASECPANVNLRASDFVATVVIVYGRTPTILVPTRFLYDSDLPIAISHELAHLRHRDSGWNLIYEAVAIVLWFNPAIRWLGDRLRICQELAADASAIQRHQCSSSRYGSMLLRFADLRCPGSPYMAAFGAKGDMVERLESLQSKPRLWKVVSLAALALVSCAMIPIRASNSPSLQQHAHHVLQHIHH